MSDLIKRLVMAKRLYVNIPCFDNGTAVLFEEAADRIADQVRDIRVLAERIAELEAQLPEGMKHCTIRFKECEKGHGRLTADNWVDHGCQQCEIDRLKGQSPFSVLKWLFKAF